MNNNKMLVALMEEYRRSAIDLKHNLSQIESTEFEFVFDPQTDDPDCKSIQTIAFHIVQSGYTYLNYFKSVNNNNDWEEYGDDIDSPEIAISEIDKLLDCTESALHQFSTQSNDELEKIKFNTRWNVTYDFEQLMEHAIVHVLRHRRQIENALINIQK